MSLVKERNQLAKSILLKLAAKDESKDLVNYAFELADQYMYQAHGTNWDLALHGLGKTSIEDESFEM